MHTVLQHPLVNHRVTLMRDQATPPKLFRELVNEITEFLAFEALKDVRMKAVDVVTPVAKARGALVDEHIVLVPILRAGMGMVEGLQTLVPVAKVGHIGLYRNEETHNPVVYYCKLPEDIQDRMVIVTDPMLATGGSACDAITMLKERGCTNIRLMCLVAVPEGIKRVQDAHPDVDIYVAAVDDHLNENAYIVPGLGDAGDRIFGTK